MRFIQKWGIVFTILLSAMLPAQAEERFAAVVQVGLYGFMLDQPLQELPICPEDAAFYPDYVKEVCFELDDGYYVEARAVFKLLDHIGGIRFPMALQHSENYPIVITLGYDSNRLITYMRVMPRKDIAVQNEIVKMVSEQLGEPVAMAIRDDSDDPFTAPPDGISLEMWFSADPGAIVAEWQTDYAWARYVGQLPGSSEGYLEIGLKRIIRNGQLPEWR